MKNNKKMLSLLTALTMTASAFSGMVASAEESTGTGVTFIPTETCQAVAVLASYDENGKLASVSLKKDIEATEGEELTVAAPAGTKVMLWNNLEELKPIANAKVAEVPVETETPEPTETETPEPTETETPDPGNEYTKLIDFTDRTLTAEATGSSTVFSVTDAESAGATALAAAGTGNVLKLGSSTNGASKNLGYKAQFAVEDGNTVVYGGQVTLSYKLEPMQVRTDKEALILLSFADINGTAILPITVNTGKTAGLSVNGTSASNIAYGNYYDVTYTIDFNAKTASVKITTADGVSCLEISNVAIDAENLTQLYKADSDWTYGYCAIDDIQLSATEIGVPVYYSITINTTRFANLTTSAGDVYYADANGKIEIPLQKPGTTFDYTLSKVGYNDVTGTVEALTADFEDTKEMTLADDSIIFIESEFGSAEGAYVSASGNRNDTVSLGSVAIPDISEITVDFDFEGFGINTGQQKTWYINTDAGKLVGIQMSDDGMYAWTGWTGSANLNQSSDARAYANGVRIGDVVKGSFTVKFVLDSTNKAITVSYGDTSASLAYDIAPTAITELGTGLYRYYGRLSTTEFKITRPDENYLAINGATGVAKISGKVIEREYSLAQTVIIPGETFEWTVTDENGNAVEGVTVENGVLKVADNATAGMVVLSCASTTNEEKKATIKVTIGDFQEMSTFTVDGPKAFDVTQTAGKYVITSAVDSFGDEVKDLLPAAVWTSSNENVLTVDEATGAVTVVGAGDTTIKATITNGTAISEKSIDVKVGTYYVVADATGDSTAVDLSNIINDATVSGYMVTTTKDGAVVNQTTVSNSETSIQVDTTGADKVEVAPIYETAINAELAVPAAVYDVTITVNSGKRTDVYVNDQMIFNNVNQGSDNWTVGRIFPETAEYTAKDVYINEGYATFKMYDDKSSGSTVTKVTFVKTPDNKTRAKRVYAIGDSLVAKYYGDAPEGSEGLVRTGWGDVLGDYMAEGVEVTNLGNSGAHAEGMLADAFTSVMHSAKPGDIVIWESGYNDRSYSTVERMKAAITTAIDYCKANDIEIYLVTPNASSHDYKSSVVWASSIIDLGTETDTPVIDLSADSYNFLNNKYAEVSDVHTLLRTVYNNTGDTLHSSYNAANCWAAIVAQGLYNAGKTDLVNTTHTYTYNDTISDITVGVGLMDTTAAEAE